MNELQRKQRMLLIVPIVLLVSCTLVFKWTSIAWGPKPGYFIGFLFYWLFWCMAIPAISVGIKAIVQLFHYNHVVWNKAILACLLLPLIFIYAYAFPTALKNASITIILLSLVQAIVNGTLEEVLWRGTFLIIFRNHKWLFLLVSSVGFAVWHYAPQVVFPNTRPGGAHSFVLFSLVLGLLFGWVAWKQQSIFWVTVTHVLFDFAGLGARLYFT